jgi:hypothetical protein
MPRKLRLEYASAIYRVVNRAKTGVKISSVARRAGNCFWRPWMRWAGREKELSRRAKGDKRKVRLGRQLRAETTMALGWIARRLQMGTSGYVNYLLYQRQKATKRII